MTLFSRLSHKFYRASFILLTFLPVFTSSIKLESEQLKINHRDTASAGERNTENIDNIINNVNISQSNSNISTKPNNFESIFKQFGVEGSIIIYDASQNKTHEHNSPRNSKAFLPASTFKILNTLIALETGIIKDDVTVLTWDGIKRSLDTWNQDTNLRQAFKNSTVWFYQVLARKIGSEQMQTFVNQAGYGNKQIGTAKNIDNFWLKGPLQITPKQQIDFLQKLYNGKLPFSERSLNLLKDIMVFEKTPNYTLRGKTGWASNTNPGIGWFVGYLEQNNQVYFFATNINMTNPKLAATRIKITRRCLQMLKLL